MWGIFCPASVEDLNKLAGVVAKNKALVTQYPDSGRFAYLPNDLEVSTCACLWPWGCGTGCDLALFALHCC